MRITRTTTAVAIAAVAALGLTACSSDAEGETEASADPTATVAQPTEEDIAALESITWTEGEDGVPVLEFETPLEVSTTTDYVVTEGDGEALEAGMYVNLDYIGFDGETGEVLYDTYSQGGAQSYRLSEETMAPSLYNALEGQAVGAQIILGETFESTDAESGEAVEVSSFTAVTVDSVTEPLDRAEGEAVDPVEGLPVVTLDDSGAPSVEIPDATPPEELVAQPLIEGEGETVESDDYLVVNYTGWLWDDGTEFDSSWTRGTPAEFSLTGVIPGWTEGLSGQTVGSQVLLVVPPEMGYGDADNGDIPANSTLVFVVDILAAL